MISETRLAELAEDIDLLKQCMACGLCLGSKCSWTTLGGPCEKCGGTGVGDELRYLIACARFVQAEDEALGLVVRELVEIKDRVERQQLEGACGLIGLLLVTLGELRRDRTAALKALREKDDAANQG